MSNYVYSGASWQCTNGGCGKICNSNSQKVNGNGILTIADLPVSDGTGVCPILQGAPCVPTCVPSSWINFSLTVKSNNKPVLLSNSTIVCPIGGLIRITKSSNNVRTGFGLSSNFASGNTNADSFVGGDQIGASESNHPLQQHNSDMQLSPSAKADSSSNCELEKELHEKGNDDSENNNFVYSGASWQCSNGGCGKIHNNNSQKVNGGGILTIADLPVSDGTKVCPILQDAPCIPTCVPGSWINFSSTVKSDYKPVLLSSSTIICLIGGGLIRITKSSNNVDTGNPFYFSGGNTNSSVDKEQIGTSESNQPIQQHSSDKQPSSSAKPNASPNNKLDEDSQGKGNDDSNSIDENNSKENNSSPEENRKNMWCCGRCPEEYKDNCDFCKAPENSVANNQLNNNSDILKNNLQSIFGYDKIAEKIRNTKIKLKANYEVDWLVPQHHHIISGNECLYRRKKGDNTMLFPLLVKLANLFKYNVNSFLNGIILPGYNTQKLTNIINIEKYELAYKVMEKEIGNTNESFGFAPEIYKFTGSQLHFGQHTYENDLIKLKSKFKYKYPILNFMKVYEKIVLKYLNILSEKVYKNRYEKTCFMRDYNKEKKFFEDYLNSISEKIRKNIKEFPRKGKLNLSFEEPAYVSLSAMAYDIGISVEELNSVLL